MDFLLNTIRQQLVRMARQPRFHRERFVLPTLTGLIVLAACVVATQSGVSTLGLTLFRALAAVAAAAACFLAANSGAAELGTCKETRVLRLLLASNVMPWQVVLGYLVPSVIWSGAMLLSVLPILILCVGFGGIGAVQILQAFVVLFATAFFSTSLGLLCGALMRNRRTATNLAAGLCVLGFILAPVGLRTYASNARSVGTVSAGFVSLVTDTILPALSPYFAMEGLFSGTVTGCALPYLVLCLAGGVVFLALTIALLPYTTFRTARAGTVWLNRSRIVFGSDDALARRYRPRSVLAVWGVWAATMVAVVEAHRHGMTGQPAMEMIPAECFLTSLAIVVTVWLYRCATIMATEQGPQLQEMLRLSLLSPQELVVHRLHGAFVTCLPWLLSTAVFGVWGCFLDNGPTALAAVTLLSGMAVLAAFLLSGSLVGLSLGVRYNPYAACAVTAVFAVASGGVLAGLLGGGPGVTLFLIGAELVLLAVAAVAADKLARFLRSFGFHR